MQNGILLLDGGRLFIPFEVLRVLDQELVVRFDEKSAVRRVLIGRLFGVSSEDEIYYVRMLPVFWTLVQRLTG